MMNPARLDWKYLGEGMLLPGISLLLAATVFALVAWYYGKQQSLYDNYSTNQEAIHENYDALVYRRRLIERYHRRYKEFQDLGFIGQERRLDWIETIRTAAKGLDLPRLSYSLEPQLQAIQPVNSASSNANIQIFQSRLELELGLVHELDLLRFFDRLEQEAPGLMKVDRCNLERRSGSEDKLVAETNILASCSLMMFSVITSDISVAETES